MEAQISFYERLCSEEMLYEAWKIVKNKKSAYLHSHLGLSLNSPILTEVRKGFEFLGIFISKNGLQLSAKKEVDLKERIEKILWNSL